MALLRVTRWVKYLVDTVVHTLALALSPVTHLLQRVPRWFTCSPQTCPVCSLRRPLAPAAPPEGGASAAENCSRVHRVSVCQKDFPTTFPVTLCPVILP